MNNNGIRPKDTNKNNKFKETIIRYGAILAFTSAYLTADAQTQFLSQNKEGLTNLCSSFKTWYSITIRKNSNTRGLIG